MSQNEWFDVVVVGGGMAGMVAAAEAAGRGARVLVCEIADELGGTAVLSTGNVWTVQSADAFRAADPGGSVELWQNVRDDLASSLEWVESFGVAVTERQTSSSSSTYDPPPIGRNVDIETFIERSQKAVEAAGGFVLLGTTVVRLITSDGAVRGVEMLTVETEQEDQIDVGAVVLASGGFQGSRELRNKYLGDTVAASVAVRSNPYSDGQGLRLALEAGAAPSDVMDTFYGVVLPAIEGEITETDYRGLVLHSVVYGVVIGPDGNRLSDESAGAVPLANEVAKVGRALLVLGETAISVAQNVLGVDLLAVLEAAAARGARTLRSSSVQDVVRVAAEWGYDGPTMSQTLAAFDSAIADDSKILPARERHRYAVGHDFLVVEVQAAMTSTYGGIKTDEHGRALTADGSAFPGLFAAGVDQGGFNVVGYTGGLSRSLVYGRRAGAMAAVTGRELRPAAGTEDEGTGK